MEQRITFVLLEVYRNIVTWPTRTGARTKDSGTKKFATTSHPRPTPFSINKEVWVLTWGRWFFGTLVHYLFSLLAFWIKSLFLAPKLRLSIYRPVVREQYELGLSNITILHLLYKIHEICEWFMLNTEVRFLHQW